MTQLTVRGFDDQLDNQLHKLAHQKGISLNKAALLLMRRGAGLDRPTQRQDVVGNSLDELFGSWTQEQQQELAEAIQIFEQVDDSFWK